MTAKKNKETYYFSHDYEAQYDPKLQEVVMMHGLAGIGAYWCIVERLYMQGGVLPLKVCKSIAFAYHAECSFIESIVKDFELFENDGEVFWSKSINKRLEKRNQIAESRKKAALTRWKSKSNAKNESNEDANAEQMYANAMQNDANKIKVKESKVNTTLVEVTTKNTTLSSTKVSSEKEKCKKKNFFAKPTIEEVRQYIRERNSDVDAERFWNFYESKDWMVGRNKMKDWKACVRTWECKDERSRASYPQPHYNSPKSLSDIKDGDMGIITEHGVVK